MGNTPPGPLLVAIPMLVSICGGVFIAQWTWLPLERQMGEWVLYICAPSGNLPRETAGQPQLYLTHPDEGPSATSSGIQSKEGETM